MKKIKTTIDGLYKIKHEAYKDSRGYFFESWNKNKLIELDINIDLLQDNISISYIII